MAYEVRYTDQINKGTIEVEDGTVNTDTSIALPGRGTAGYGQIVAESFLHLLENFANTQSPASPVEGQLWYDNTPGIDQLKIYDGTNWVAAGGLKKSTDAPDVATSVVGDLWVDTDNQQLYLFTGAGWQLVGPEFSEGLSTGARASTIIGQDDNTYTVLLVEINAELAAIVSTDAFTPKTTIAGFSNILPGINLSGRNFNGNLLKYRGLAQEAESLRVGNNSVPAANFLRSDVLSTTNFPLRVKNNSGLAIGASGQLVLSIEGDAGIIQHNTTGSNVDIRVNNNGSYETAIRINSNKTIGINNEAPEEALDVTGNIQVSGHLLVNNLQDSSNINTGSIITKGGAAVAKNFNVGGNTTVQGVTTLSTTLPDLNNTRDLGSPTQRWENVYSTRFIGNLEGNVSGTISGRAGSANKIASLTTFRMTGDVSAPDFTFDGQTGGATKTFNTTISNTFVAGQQSVTEVGNLDEFLVNVTSGITGLYKVSKQNLLRSITRQLTPVGTITAYAGSTPPEGWFLCDGSEILRSEYLDLFNIVGYNFRPPSQINAGPNDSSTHFALPDLRGRFPLGLDNMDNNFSLDFGGAANRVTDVNADTIGGTAGSESNEIRVNNLPQHEHDLRSTDADRQQFYAISDTNINEASSQAIPFNSSQSFSFGASGSTTGSALGSSGGILNGGVTGTSDYTEITDNNGNVIEQLGAPFNTMNPYMALNYIIYHGVIQ
jgi:microcystin-dependent protein